MSESGDLLRAVIHLQAPHGSGAASVWTVRDRKEQWRLGHTMCGGDEAGDRRLRGRLRQHMYGLHLSCSNHIVRSSLLRIDVCRFQGMYQPFLRLDCVYLYISYTQVENALTPTTEAGGARPDLSGFRLEKRSGASSMLVCARAAVSDPATSKMSHVRSTSYCIHSVLCEKTRKSR